VPRLRAVARRCRARVAPEQPREVALVGEAGLGRDLSERAVAAGELRRGLGEPEPPSVLADGNSVPHPEGPCEPCRVNPHGNGQLAESQRPTRALPEQLLS
jgi:hypothetical protein